MSTVHPELQPLQHLEIQGSLLEIRGSQKELREGQATSCPAEPPLYRSQQRKSSGRVLGTRLHEPLPVLDGFGKGRGGSGKDKQVLEALASKLEQILADFPCATKGSDHRA